jgi:FAD synthase
MKTNILTAQEAKNIANKHKLPEEVNFILRTIYEHAKKGKFTINLPTKNIDLTPNIRYLKSLGYNIYLNTEGDQWIIEWY